MRNLSQLLLRVKGQGRYDADLAGFVEQSLSLDLPCGSRDRSFSCLKAQPQSRQHEVLPHPGPPSSIRQPELLLPTLPTDTIVYEEPKGIFFIDIPPARIR